MWRVSTLPRGAFKINDLEIWNHTNDNSLLFVVDWKWFLLCGSLCFLFFLLAEETNKEATDDDERTQAAGTKKKLGSDKRWTVFEARFMFGIFLFFSGCCSSAILVNLREREKIKWLISWSATAKRRFFHLADWIHRTHENNFAYNFFFTTRREPACIS